MLDRAFELARKKLEKAPLPEELSHAEDVMRCIKELYPDDLLLHFAAFVHDIERAREDRLRKEDFSDYDEFKKAHAEKSAELAVEILRSAGISDQAVLQRVKDLVAHHESGGFPEADALKECDALSFFRNNLPHFARRSSESEIRQRIRWGLRRLSPELLSKVAQIDYPDERIREIVEQELSAIISHRE